MAINTESMADDISFETMLSNLNLPLDIHWQLKKLALSHVAFSHCIKSINATEPYQANELVTLLRKELNLYFEAIWEYGDNDQSFIDGLWGSPKDRKFQYVSDEVITDIFCSKPQTCVVCNKEKKLTIKHWQYPEMLIICSDCIDDSSAFQKYKISFHPQRQFSWNTSAPFNQIYLLTARTPPIISFCENQEPYRWARHCGDFALYQGDVHPSTLEYDLVDQLCLADGADTDDMLNSWDSNYGNSVIHKFECLYCKETLYTYDYSI